MALTDEEKRMLAQLEASLAADDPQLAHRMRGVGQRRLPVRRLGLAVGVFAVGVALLVVGMQVHPLISVLGFLVMLTASVLGLGAVNAPAPRPTRATARRQPRARGQRTRGQQPAASDAEFMDRMEERWRKRQDGSL